MINNKIIKASPAKKQIQTNQEQATQKGLSKVEGILTSPLQINWPKEGTPYYLGFFQLEGLEQDIPTIFKLDSDENWAENKPDIPPKAKVLLEGKWANSDNSPRPSFTCLAYQIITTPPPPTIKSLREQISQLLKVSLEKQSEWKKRTDYLFKRVDYLNDLQKLTKLGDRYLAAYLLLKSADYANYQDNLLPHTVNLVYFQEYLAKIQSEIEDIAFQIRAYEAKKPCLT